MLRASPVLIPSAPILVYNAGMCGRYTLTVDQRTVEERFGAKFVAGRFEPTYNAAPGQQLPIICALAPHEIVYAKWGFVPEDWKNARPQINARVETADQKRTFSSSFRSRRCLVIADGFYEWKAMPTGKRVPYRFVLNDGEPFAMAGIYSREDGDDSPLTFAILTTAANEAVRPVHHRMPVILPLRAEKSWLPAAPSGMTVFPPIAADLVSSYPVSTRVNDARFNQRSVIDPMIPEIR
jgi:putative SOS response-associated peptidase YedK